MRTAALHLLELAAAFEGRGAAIADASPADQAVLSKVVDALLRHRAQQRRRQRDATLASLVRALSEDYKHFGEHAEEPALWLQDRVIELCRELGFRPDDAELDALVVDRRADDGLAISGGDNQGAVVTAERALAAAVDRSERTIATARSVARGPDTSTLIGRHTFGRWVPLDTLRAYAQELVDSQRAVGVAPSLTSLRELREAGGVPLDRAVERSIGSTFTTNAGLRAALEMPAQGPAHAAFQRAFKETIASYHDLVRGFAIELHALLKEHGFADQPQLAPDAVAVMRLPAVGESVDSAVRGFVLARLTASGATTLDAAEGALKQAVQSQLIADACRRFSERFTTP